jgi:hypothetical protein
MRLENIFRLRYVSIFLFLFMSGAASYAQPKSATTSITVIRIPAEDAVQRGRAPAIEWF